MKPIRTTLTALLVLLAVAAAAQDEDWQPPIGPDYEKSPPANAVECLRDVRTFYNEGSYAWAVAAAEYYVDHWPDGMDRPEVEYTLALCRLNQQEYDGVLDGLELVMSKYSRTSWAVDAADVYVDLFSEVQTPWYGWDWSYWLAEQYDVDYYYDYENEKMRKARKDALKKAEKAYKNYMKGKTGREREALADRNVYNFMIMMPYVVSDYYDKPGKTYEEKLSYVENVLGKEMSRDMESVLQFYVGVLIAQYYPVDADLWDEDADPDYYVWEIEQRLAAAEEHIKGVAETYGDSLGALAARAALAHYDVVYHNDPTKAAAAFDELASMMTDEDYAEYLEQVAEDLRGPALAVISVVSNPREAPEVTVRMAAKLYDEVEVTVYPVDPKKYYDVSSKLNAVDIYMKDGRKMITDSETFYTEGFGERIHDEDIDRVVPRPTADLPGVGAPVKTLTAATRYAGDLRVSAFDVDIEDLDPGLYIVEATAEDNLARALFLHTEAAAVYTTDNMSVFFELVDTENGAPVSIGEFTALSIYYEEDERGYSREKTKEVDLNTRVEGDGLIADFAGLELSSRLYLIAESARGPAFIEVYTPYYEPETKTEMGIVYTDRPLYRPEQVVGYKAVLRQVDYVEKTLSPLVGRTVDLRLASPTGDDLWTGEATTDEYGAFWGDIQLPPGAPLGYYYLYANWSVGEGDEERYYSAYGYFSLEEYEKPEYELTVEPEKDRYLSGETVRMVAEGRYFFGEPMAGADVYYEVTRSGYTDKDYEYSVLKKKGDGYTDEDGRFVIEFPTEWAGKYDNYYNVYVKITDVSEHVVEGYGYAYTYRADRYVSMYTDKYDYHIGEAVKVDVSTWDWYDEPVSMPVDIAFYEYPWDPEKGYVKGDVLYSTTVTTGADGAAEHIVELPNAPISDTVLVESVIEDTQGTEVMATATVNFVGEEVVTTERVPEVEITVGEDDYYPKLGDTITVKVRSRFDDVTVGVLYYADGVQGFENLTLTRDADGGYSHSFDVYVDDRFLPELRMKAIVIKDNEYYESDVYVYITNTNTQMDITVEIDEDEFQPGETAEVTVKCADNLGLPVIANLSLSAVDESLLALRADTTEGLPYNFSSALYRYYYPYVYNSLYAVGDISNATYLFKYYNNYYGYGGYVPYIEDSKASEYLNRISLPYYANPDIEEFIYYSGIDQLNPEYYDKMTAWEAATKAAPMSISGAGAGGGLGAAGDMYARGGEMAMEEAELGYFEGDMAAPAVSEKKALKDKEVTTTGAMPNEAVNGMFAVTGEKTGMVDVDGREMMQAQLRKFFADSAYWKPDLYTDSNGEVTVEVTMPDNLTTWKVMALGVNKGQRIGWNFDTCNVTKNVLVRLTTPRHLVVGDTAQIKAIAHNYLDTKKEFAVSIDLDNLMLAEGETKTFADVEPNGMYTFKQWVWADRAGEATFVAAALTDVESDAMTKSIMVHPHGVVQRQAFCGRLRDAIEHELVLADAIDPDTFEAELIMSPSLAASLSHGLEFFDEYPYDCVEQALNRFLVNALLADAAGELGLDESKLSDGLTEAIDEGVAKLEEAQTADGGWPWWKGGKPSPYMTAYALDGLYALRGSPFLSDMSATKVENMISSGTEYLKWYISELEKDPERYDWELSLFIADVALRNGIIEPDNEIVMDTADYYFEYRSEKSDRGLVLLGSLLYQMGMTDELAVVFRNLDNGAKVGPDQTIYWGQESTWCWYWWDDAVETTAKVLDLKMEADPASPQVPHMVDWLVDERRGAAWKSTKDSAEATKTLIRYILKYPEASAPIVVSYVLGEAKTGGLELDPTDYEEPSETVEFDLADFHVGENALKVTRDSGRGPVFYTMAVEYYTEAEEIPAVQGSVTIDRDYYIVKRKFKKGKLEEERVPLDRPLKVGEELEVEITVNSPYDFDYVVVEDPRPAGCIYTEMASGYNWWLDAYVELKTEKRAVLFERLNQGETKFSYRLRAEIPGDFAALPATVYGMYSPDIGSSTASSRVEVEE
jgi:uncharacterized protein YfaS (alpha-2-macroglobulin family)